MRNDTVYARLVYQPDVISQGGRTPYTFTFSVDLLDFQELQNFADREQHVPHVIIGHAVRIAGGQKDIEQSGRQTALVLCRLPVVVKW